MPTAEQKRLAADFLREHRKTLDLIAEQGSPPDWLLAASITALADLVLPTTESESGGDALEVGQLA